MNPLRAVPFTDSARTRLEPVRDWPRLPADLTLDRVVGVAVDSRSFIYVAHRGAGPEAGTAGLNHSPSGGGL